MFKLRSLYRNAGKKSTKDPVIKNPTPPLLINTFKGFVRDDGNRITFTPNSRLATPYPDFETADNFAKDVVIPMLVEADERNKQKQYFSILCSA